MARGTLFIRGGTDHIVIPNVRTDVRWKFDAGQWTELRIGWFLSITAASNNDLTTGLAETISQTTSPYDCYWLGLKSDGPLFPFAGASQFVGFTNFGGAFPVRAPFDSKLVSSDIGVGTSNAYWWRPTTSVLPGSPNGFCGFSAKEYTQNRSSLGVGWEQHFAQDTVNAGGYGTCLGFRLRRSSPTSTLFTVDVKASTADDCQLQQSNTVTQDNLLSILTSWPTSVRTSPQILFQAMPTTMFLYWPFTQSRLRIMSRGFYRFR